MQSVIPSVLEPSLDFLRQEYVLVQAWKKTSAYIRYHNWYADTLELDWTTVNLQYFISEIQERLGAQTMDWESGSIRFVPAPKRQRWKLSPNSSWGPVNKGDDGVPIRPLAYVSIQEQVVATALMLCLANRVETRQGDPREDLHDPDSRKNVISYGNRLFCDKIDNKLHHRWGSSKLYRAYFEDYRSFISRPTIVAQEIKQQVNSQDKRIFIIESDLKQFYDRVRPEILGRALQRFQRSNDDAAFFAFACWVLDWKWDNRDIEDVTAYAKQVGLDDFARVALPQGLVSAGFFANVVLLAFDAVLKNNIGSEIEDGIRLEDACRYVDDLRIVVTTDRGAEECQNAVCNWLQSLLDKDKSGLLVAEDKTKIAEFGGFEYPLVRQSSKMERIQTMVSGGFDALGGIETLDAIQGLLRSQEALSNKTIGHSWKFSPIPDVRDETVARFSAARFRTTYRSLRPLLDEGYLGDTDDEVTVELDDPGNVKTDVSRKNLDEDARTFALSLIERWVNDPSNVRLLRIGFDIYPDVNVLKEILKFLRPFAKKGGRKKALRRRIAWYCLAELLRAGATETGYVEDDELLPSDINIQLYRETLGKEATRLIALPTATIPWYLRQQALLFLAVFDPVNAPVTHAGRKPEIRRYRKLLLFLNGNTFKVTNAEFATLAVLGRRAFTGADRSGSIDLYRLNDCEKKRDCE